MPDVAYATAVPSGERVLEKRAEMLPHCANSEEANAARSVLIVSNRLFREGIELLIFVPGISFAPGVTSVAEAVDLMDLGAIPDLAITVVVGDEAFLETTSSIALARKRHPRTRWLLLTDIVSSTRLQRAVAVGADALLHYEISSRVLRHATELLLLGQSLLPLSIAEACEHTGNSQGQRASARPRLLEGEGASTPSFQAVQSARLQFKLSDREGEILDCLVDGPSNKEIARRLDIAEATVKLHVKGLLRKLGVANRTQAAVLALYHRSQWQTPAASLSSSLCSSASR